MEQYTVDQAAERLGLHVKTVRAYIRDGRLKAVKVGRRYRIARQELEAFAGLPESPEPGRHVEASSIVQIDGIGRAEMDRLSTMVIGSVTSGPQRLNVQVVYDEDRAHLKIIILGDLEPGAQLLRIIDALTREQL
ncbi:helix-turn-helix domain-containing protein [Nonomuraea cavernae]|uniref:MerR family transcriptional regulator n=1 Tax=Nonomuraea cavernae TaxID=2045107 RepID=A0A918DF47_9ACTN|nr:helix-turn-helix domain-containing protein [Nonomuraea cavernae]MCA2184540.1 helix-turn-helix domain-containing protein [Nonomuraea cavernae]GGO63481.1 MerR family transcriptional regulator [Nonomuraea cavernae]